MLLIKFSKIDKILQKSSCELNFVYVHKSNVSKDCNFGGFPLPSVYVHAHKLLEHQIIGEHWFFPTLSVLRRTLAYYFKKLVASLTDRYTAS